MNNTWKTSLQYYLIFYFIFDIEGFLFNKLTRLNIKKNQHKRVKQMFDSNSSRLDAWCLTTSLPTHKHKGISLPLAGPCYITWNNAFPFPGYWSLTSSFHFKNASSSTTSMSYKFIKKRRSMPDEYRTCTLTL